MPATIQDISRNGFALLVQTECKKGVVLSIQLDGVTEQFAGPWLGRVVNVRPFEAGIWVVGCAFCSEFIPAELEALLRSRGQPAPAPPEAAPSPAAAPIESARPPAPVLNATERRSAPRRGGKRVAIIIAPTSASAKRFVGRVIDGSAGGLALAMPRPLSVGTVVKVRAANVGLAIPWATVRVRHCQRSNHQWIVGCQFIDAIPSSLLETFC